MRYLAIEASAERDALLDALVLRVPDEGWTMAAARRAAEDAGQDPRDAEMLFPRGAVELVEAWADLADVPLLLEPLELRLHLRRGGGLRLLRLGSQGEGEQGQDDQAAHGTSEGRFQSNGCALRSGMGSRGADASRGAQRRP